MTPDSPPITVFDPAKQTSPGSPLILGPKEEPGKIIQADASGHIRRDPAKEQAQLVLQPFSDGSLFRYGPSGKPDGSQVLVDANNRPVALVCNQFLADFLCRAAHLFFVQLKEMQTQQSSNENIPSPTGKNIPEKGPASTR